MENPFSVKVLQVFTGFGVGCGVGIGVGRPIYLGMIPGLQQVMSATRGATDAFSGVTRHVNSALRTAGLKNIEAGIGCGVGIGHGFGIGIALKPRVLHGIQSSVGDPLFQNDTKVDFRDAVRTKTFLNPGNLHGMDSVLQLVLKHQKVIEELQEENENLRQILIEELKISPTKLQIGHKNGVKAYYPCSDCFECRRRSRRTTR
eukprot:XP_023157043.1 uncharacterized protein LOC103638923 isoform X3 [Zea mays]